MMPDPKKSVFAWFGSFVVINSSRVYPNMAVNKQHNHKAYAQASPLPSSENPKMPNIVSGPTHCWGRDKSLEAINPRALVFFAVKLLGPSVFTDQ